MTADDDLADQARAPEPPYFSDELTRLLRLGYDRFERGESPGVFAEAMLSSTWLDSIVEHRSRVKLAEAAERERDADRRADAWMSEHAALTARLAAERAARLAAEAQIAQAIDLMTLRRPSDKTLIECVEGVLDLAGNYMGQIGDLHARLAATEADRDGWRLAAASNLEAMRQWGERAEAAEARLTAVEAALLMGGQSADVRCRAALRALAVVPQPEPATGIAEERK